MAQREEHESKREYSLIIFLACLMHVVFMVTFACFGMKGYSLYNLTSALFYLGLLFIVNEGHYRVVTVCTHVEVSLFVTICTLTLGYDYGFVLYLIAMSSLMYFNPFRQKERIYITHILEFLLFFALKLWDVLANPGNVGPRKGASCFGCINSMGCFLVIFVGAVASKVATDRLKREHYQLTRDRLTGIYNREYFLESADHLLRTEEKEFYLVYTNILGFKFYNELFGTDMGNQVLIAHGETLRATSGCTRLYGRLAADEFAILIEKEKYREENFLRYKTELEKRFSSPQYHMHMYIGVYEISDHRESVAAMCERIRIAMSDSKGDFDKHFLYYNEKILEASLQESRILGEFSQALESGQFEIFIQPQVTRNGAVRGGEALVRWRHPERGMIPPGAFIPILEKRGLIGRLDLYVWEQAAAYLKKWKDAGREDFYISVNVSVRDFYYVDIYKTFTGLVEKYEIDPKNLKIEITETVFIEEAENHIDSLNRLRSRGFGIGLDDFGSGYSSLNMLKDFDVDVLKIDMGFLGGREDKKRSWDIISSVFGLANTLGIQTVMEGVETKSQVDRLTDIGCQIFQGFYFARPMEAASFEEKYLYKQGRIPEDVMKREE